MSSLPPEVVRDRVCAQLAVADAAQARLRGLSTDLVGNAFRIEVAGRLETQERVNRGLSYRVCGDIADPPDGPDDPGLPAGVKVIDLLRSRLTLTAGEVRRRMKVAARIRPRRSVSIWRCSRTTSARPLYLGRSRRLASPDQRIFCHARSRSAPRRRA